MFEVVHCFICCWHEPALDGGFCHDLFFYNIQKSLNNCNKVSTNAFFLRECSIVYVFIIFYSEFLIIPYIYHSSDPFYSRCNFFIFHCYGMQQLVGVNYAFDCCVTLWLWVPEIFDRPSNVIIYVSFSCCQDMLGKFWLD